MLDRTPMENRKRVSEAERTDVSEERVGGEGVAGHLPVDDVTTRNAPLPDAESRCDKATMGTLA